MILSLIVMIGFITTISGSNTCENKDCPFHGVCQVINGAATCTCHIACNKMLDPVCDSDGVTHSNECMMNARSCQLQKTITVKSKGRCEAGPCAVVRCGYFSNCQVINGSATCVCPSICAAVYSPVCGSDGQTYGNECSMRAASCRNRKMITVVHKGKCGSGGCAAVTCHEFATCTIVNGKPECKCFMCKAAYRPVCGSDGKTYSNTCQMRTVSCRESRKITVVKEGKCETGPCATVRCAYHSNCQVINGSAKCVCSSLCPEYYSPICGSDGQTYSNECFMKAASCKYRKTITVAHKGTCASDGCSAVICPKYGKCVVIDGKPQCGCMMCKAIYSPVCGSDGKTYSNECQMNSVSCRENKEITLVNEGKCGQKRVIALAAGIALLGVIGLLCIGLLVYFRVCKPAWKKRRLHQFSTLKDWQWTKQQPVA